MLALLISTFGGTILLHYLKNFLLKERLKFHLDWDGLLERLCITYIILYSLNLWFFIPLIILAKLSLRIYLLKSISGITQSEEPGIVAQKVLYKSELAFDLLVSPAFAILIGVLF